jgi:linoleoyl-CoA desaturase
MYLKSAFMVSLYLIPYLFMVFGHVENKLVFFGLWILMGLGMSGIGLSIMHDANHGSYSSKKWINNIMGGMIYFVGGNALNWKIQHNVLHHTYTNVDGLDQDIDAPAFLLRFSPHQPKNKLHRYQHLYAWFFYSFLTLTWAFDADFRQIMDFKKQGLTKAYKKNFSSVMIELIFFKLVYYAFIFVLPMVFSVQPWWMILLGFLAMQMLSGLLLSCIFQMAHVVPTSDFPKPNHSGEIENSWTVHQLNTTANFAENNKLITWFVGGLNRQVEHHLFPNICHIHYPEVSKIVRKTAQDFNIAYHSYPTFGKALYQHATLLKNLGRA